MSPLDPYEHAQLDQIRAWRAQSPGFATRTLGKATSKATDMVQKAIPDVALRLALESVHAAATKLADRRSILKHAGVNSLEELYGLPLQTCDGVAAKIGRRATLLAGSSGALFGVAGTFGMVADVPTLLTVTFRTIHRLALCYGEDLTAPERRRLPVAVFALASANTLEEKQEALTAIDHEYAHEHDPAWREGIERAAQRELAKDAAVFSINNLGKTLVRRLGLRKAGESIPFLGAFVGGGVNAWYLNDVVKATQHTFQLRWLRRKYGHHDPLALTHQTES
jgi:hypothetical protein